MKEPTADEPPGSATVVIVTVENAVSEMQQRAIAIQYPVRIFNMWSPR